MRFNSTLTTAVGGAIGNMVGLTNRAGQCLRARVTPSNPNTSYQQGVRATLGDLASAWSATLSVAQRIAWAQYAATLVYTSKIGTPYTISGFNAFVASNAARIVAGLSQINDAPTIGGFAGGTQPTVTFVESTNKVSVAFTNTDDWAGEVGGAMTVRVCPIGFLAGVNYYEGPFVFLDSIDGAVTPPSSPSTFTPPFTIEVGVQYAVATRFLRADGRYSLESFFRGIGA